LGQVPTIRSALQALILELAAKPRGRPRTEAPNWATFEMTPELEMTPAEIDKLREQVSAVERSPAEREQLHRDLTSVFSNPLSLSPFYAKISYLSLDKV
jgi:hypothetical protein